MKRYIFVTGGVVSSVGKGVVASAIGRMLRQRGLKVTVQKLDPYLNVDPGTMSPYQHGEVFVTDDGAETDLDLGHYERYVDINLRRESSVSSGQIYTHVLAAERRGDYLGGTIQVVPHITDEIISRIKLAGKLTKADIVIVEVGGTVGDIEGQPFIEAIRQMRYLEGRKKTLYIHLTWLPYIGATGELKTKPTQHSVRELRSMGIQPDLIVLRADQEISPDLLRKTAMFCDVDEKEVFALQTNPYPYEVPLQLEEQNLGGMILHKLKLGNMVQSPDWSDWKRLVQAERTPMPEIHIAIVGKYVELEDAYKSVKESLKHAAMACERTLKISWIHAEDLEKGQSWEILRQADGIVVPGGFGERGVQGKILAAQYAREHKVPYLGLCLGMQILCIEFARNVMGWADANSTEFTQTSSHAIISLLEEQEGITNKGGTMRLGVYPCQLVPHTKAAQAYGNPEKAIKERHRHRWEFNNLYREAMSAKGLLFSGLSPDASLVEIAEVQDHPYMLGSQFHPEFLSRPNRPHPLFRGLIQAAIQRSDS
jgi:CTP synthase